MSLQSLESLVQLAAQVPSPQIQESPGANVPARTFGLWDVFLALPCRHSVDWIHSEEDPLLSLALVSYHQEHLY